MALQVEQGGRDVRVENSSSWEDPGTQLCMCPDLLFSDFRIDSNSREPLLGSSSSDKVAQWKDGPWVWPLGWYGNCSTRKMSPLTWGETHPSWLSSALWSRGGWLWLWGVVRCGPEECPCLGEAPAANWPPFPGTTALEHLPHGLQHPGTGLGVQWVRN